MAETESESPARIKCPDCDETFVNNSGLSSHRRAVHKLVDEEARARWQHRKQQIEENKLKGTGKFICDVKGCGRRFKAPTALGYHKRVTHGIVGKYSAKHTLQKQRRHQVGAVNQYYDSKRKLHVCPECGRGFQFAKALGKHRSSKHQIAGSAQSTLQHRKKQQTLAAAAEEPLSLVCKDCGQGPFKNRSGLNIHRTTMHKGVIPSGNGASSANEIAVAFWISQTCNDFKQIAAINAGRVDLTAEEFGARCLAILSGSSKTLRKLYRLPD